jgi:hypothetical protein
VRRNHLPDLAFISHDDTVLSCEEGEQLHFHPAAWLAADPGICHAARARQPAMAIQPGQMVKIVPTCRRGTSPQRPLLAQNGRTDLAQELARPHPGQVWSFFQMNALSPHLRSRSSME